MRETRPLCFSCGFAEGLHVHEVRDDGEECVAWPDMDDFNAGFAALRSEVSSLVSALEEIRDTVNDPREIAIRALEKHAKGGKG